MIRTLLSRFQPRRSQVEVPPTLMEAQGGDAVSLAVLLQAQLLLVQVHGCGVDSRPLQMQTDPLPPQPPESSAGSKVSVTRAVSVTTQDHVRRLASSNWECPRRT